MNLLLIPVMMIQIVSASFDILQNAALTLPKVRCLQAQDMADSVNCRR